MIIHSYEPRQFSTTSSKIIFFEKVPMSFTLEQDIFIVAAYYRNCVRGEDGEWRYPLQPCFNNFLKQFPTSTVTCKTFGQHRIRLIKRFTETGSIVPKIRESTPTVLTEDTVQDIKARIDVSPSKSIRKLCAQAGVSYGSCQRALTRKLRKYPYKVSVFQELDPYDHIHRVNYCEWFNQTLKDDVMLDLTFFSGEAWFHLSGYVNSQDYRIWSTDNPHAFTETNLHPQKIGIWVAMSRRRIVGPYFFQTTINAEQYREDILRPFVQQLNEEELLAGYFQQDTAPSHTAAATVDSLEEVFDDRLISRGRWPPRSPDLSPLDYFLFGHLKNKVFTRTLHTIEELKQAILEEINLIDVTILRNVFANMQRRVKLCLEHEGAHFQQFL